MMQQQPSVNDSESQSGDSGSWVSSFKYQTSNSSENTSSFQELSSTRGSSTSYYSAMQKEDEYDEDEDSSNSDNGWLDIVINSILPHAWMLL
jgi:hypothetical protein